MTVFPTSLDVLPKPGPSALEDDPGFEHDLLHSGAAEAIEALQAKVGTTAQANARVHVGPTQPEGPGPYLWWQTVPDGSMTLWIEDGL